MALRPSASHAWLAVALVATAVLQAVLIARLPTISADGITFIAMARQLPQDVAATLRGNDQHPGFPALLLAATQVVHAVGYRAEPESWMVGGLAVSFVCGLGSVWLIWLLSRELFDARAANYAALIFAVLPLARAGAADAQSDTPHLLAYLVAVWLGVKALKGGRLALWAGTGAASGIAYWIRPEGLEVFLVAVPCLAWQARRRQWPWRRLALASAALAGATLIVAGPYPLLAGKITSKQVPFAKVNAAPTFIDQLAEVPSVATQESARPAIQPTAAPPPPCPPPIEPPPGVSATAAPTAPEEAPLASPPPSSPAPVHRYSASLVLKLFGSALATLLVSLGQGFKFVFVPFYALGHFEVARRRPDRVLVVFTTLLGLVHMAALLLVFMLSGYIAHRHVLPIVALSMPCTALGVIFVGDVIAALVRAGAPQAALATLAVACAVVAPYTLRRVNREFLPVIDATHWVEAHAEPGAGIVCNSPYVQFYGSLPVTSLGPHRTTLNEALAQAESAAHYDFVVLHVNAHDYRPEWLAEIERDYRQVHEFADPHTGGRPKKVLVFQAKESLARHSARGEATN